MDIYREPVGITCPNDNDLLKQVDQILQEIDNNVAVLPLQKEHGRYYALGYTKSAIYSICVAFDKLPIEAINIITEQYIEVRHKQENANQDGNDNS